MAMFAFGEPGWVLGSIEGKCEVRTFDPLNLESSLNSNSRNNFAFKAHRQQFDIYAVNSISFNRKYGTFATTVYIFI